MMNLIKKILFVTAAVVLLLTLMLVATYYGFATFATWEFILKALGLVASWVVIILLLVERSEKERPYLIVSYEPIRSTLACLVIRNVGKVPAMLNSLQVKNDEFSNQLNQDARLKLQKYHSTYVPIFPDQCFVICLDVNVFDIIQKFRNKVAIVQSIYTPLESKKKYKNTVNINWEEYAGFLVYSSELDEIKRSINSLTNSINQGTKSFSKEYVRLHNHIETLTTFCDEWQRYVACGSDRNRGQE